MSRQGSNGQTGKPKKRPTQKRENEAARQRVRATASTSRRRTTQARVAASARTSIASARLRAARERARLAPVIKKFKLLGTEITRKKVGTKVTFHLGTFEINLAEWIKLKIKQLKAAEKKKQEKHLKPFIALFAKNPLPAAARKKKIAELRKQLQAAGANAVPTKANVGDRNRQLLNKTTNPRRYTVAAAVGAKPINYNHVLPARIQTMIISRKVKLSNGKTETRNAVCIRYGTPPRLISVHTGRPPQMRAGDVVNIVSANDAQDAPAAVVAARNRASGAGSGGSSGGGSGGSAPSGSSGNTPAAPSGSTSLTPTPTSSSPEFISSGNHAERNFDSLSIGENMNQYEKLLVKKTITNPVTGKKIKILMPKNIPANATVNVVNYFHGLGSPASKFNSLTRTSHHKKHMNGIGEMAKQGKYTAFVLYEGGSQESKWKKMCEPDKFGTVLGAVRQAIGVPANRSKNYLMGHSHAFVFMQRLLAQVPANTFAGITVLDSIYGVKSSKKNPKKHVNWDKWCKLLAKHKRTKFFFLSSLQHNNNNSPLTNSRRIIEWLKKNPNARSPQNTAFFTTKQSHGPLKGPGIYHSLKYHLGLS